MQERVPMLITGYEAAREELLQLKTIDRPSVIKAIEVAREHGDLSENAEYHAAKEQQGFIEARVMELEDRLGRADVIDPSAMSGDSIKFGATVTLVDEEDKKIVYQIVGAFEADAKNGRISYTSPLGRALIGKSAGEEVEVITPSGEKYYEVEKVQYK